MTIHRTKRRLLFYALVLAFLVVTPLALIIATGYSFNLRSLSLSPAGGIFLKTNQNGIKIWLDDKMARETAFIISGALFSNVSVGTHHVRIEKAGYRDWKKYIEVKHGIVSEYRAIMLIPENPPLISKSDATHPKPFNYYPSPDRKYNAVLSQTPKKLIIQDTASGLNIFEKFFSKTSPVFAEWSGDTSLLVRFMHDDSEALFLRLADSGDFEEINIKFLKTLKRQAIAEIKPHPSDKNLLFILGEDNKVYRYQITDNAVEPIINQALHFEVYEEKIYFVNERGFFSSAAFNGSDIQVIERPGFFLNGLFASYPSEIGGLISWIDGVSGFFIYNGKDHYMKPLTTGVRSVSFNETASKALLQREHDLLTLFVAKENTMPFRDSLTLEKIIPDQITTILDSAWYTPNYALFTTDEGLFGAEIGIRQDDYTMQKITDESGYIGTDGKTIRVINEKGIFRYAIE